MTFAQAISSCFRNYFEFTGRASRLEYWWFVLFLIIAYIPIGIVDIIYFGVIFNSAPVFGLYFFLGTFFPMLAVSWIRLHDIGKGGWWYFLIFLIPFFIMTVLIFKDSIIYNSAYFDLPVYFFISLMLDVLILLGLVFLSRYFFNNSVFVIKNMSKSIFLGVLGFSILRLILSVLTGFTFWGYIAFGFGLFDLALPFFWSITWYIIWFTKEGDEGENQYGPDPRATS